MLLWTYWERNLFLVVNECDSSWLVIISWNMSWQWSCLLDFAGILFQSIPFSDTWSLMVFQHQHPKMMANSQHISTSININIYQGLSHISHGFKKYPSISLKQQPGPCPLVPPGEERQPDGLYRVTRWPTIGRGEKMQFRSQRKSKSSKSYLSWYKSSDTN